MVADVNAQVIDQPLARLARAPGPSKEPVEIGPQHRAGVVEREKRIKADLFELPLARDAAAPARCRAVPGQRMMGLEVPGIVRVFVRKPVGRGRDQGLETIKSAFQPSPRRSARGPYFWKATLDKSPFAGICET